MRENVHMSTGDLEGQKRMSDSPSAGVTKGYESPNMSTKDQIQVLWNTRYVLLTTEPSLQTLNFMFKTRYISKSLKKKKTSGNIYLLVRT